MPRLNLFLPPLNVRFSPKADIQPYVDAKAIITVLPIASALFGFGCLEARVIAQGWSSARHNGVSERYHAAVGLVPAGALIAPAGGLQTARAIQRQNEIVPHATSPSSRERELLIALGDEGGASSFAPAILSSAILAAMMEENVTGNGVPGRWRSVGSDSTVCSSDAQADRMARFSSKSRFGSLTT